MTPPGPDKTLDQSIDIEDLRKELESQLGAVMGQIAGLQLLLRKREDEIHFLRDQLAARDAEGHASGSTGA